VGFLRATTSNFTKRFLVLLVFSDVVHLRLFGAGPECDEGAEGGHRRRIEMPYYQEMLSQASCIVAEEAGSMQRQD